MMELSSEVWAALFGALIGGLLTVAGQFMTHHLSTREKKKLDEKRKQHLLVLLANPGPDGWKKLATMANVIGTSKEETARLLIELDARASENGKEVWALIKDKPFKKSEVSKS